ncbi:MAG: TetR/AcrR family transcriptional regulator [Cyanothece sp. SIO1E1]|nr:TetR/AcrR family transcriptional regulator [Cyanothece sp. SIO1E1]
MQVFLEGGYAGTSMDRVAAKAGVSKHTIYNHFQNKDGLFVALIERLTLRHFQLEFGCQLPVADPPEQVLQRLAYMMLGRMDDPEYIAFIRLMMAESGRFPHLAQLYVQQVIQRGNKILSEYFQAHPELKIADPRATAHIFFGSLVAYIMSQEVLHGKHIIPIPKENLVDNLIQLILCAQK